MTRVRTLPIRLAPVDGEALRLLEESHSSIQYSTVRMKTAACQRRVDEVGRDDADRDQNPT